jgi:hypothetical protein
VRGLGALRFHNAPYALSPDRPASCESVPRDADRRHGQRVIAKCCGRLSGRAQMVHQVARRQQPADQAFAKASSVRRDDVGTRFHVAKRQRDRQFAVNGLLAR